MLEEKLRDVSKAQDIPTERLESVQRAGNSGTAIILSIKLNVQQCTAYTRERTVHINRLQACTVLACLDRLSVLCGVYVRPSTVFLVAGCQREFWRARILVLGNH